MRTFVVLLLGGLCLRAADPATDPAPKKVTKEQIARAEKAVKDHLARLKGSHAQVQYVSEEAVARAVPGHAFFSVLFRQFPVARAVPEGLKPSSLFVVNPEGKVVVLESSEALAKYVHQHLAPADTDERAKVAARAFLRLGQQYLQDGFFRFETQDDAIKVTREKDKRIVEAKAVVMEGGNGQLTVRMTFTAAGKLEDWGSRGMVRAGPRPRCQATKLLDPDPIVRAMAEDALLSMGRAARDYLEEQKAKAAPELKRAIERIWQRIVERER